MTSRRGYFRTSRKGSNCLLLEDRLGHRDTNDDRDTGNINDDRNTGIVRIEVTDRDTGTQMTTGTPGHREYK